MKALTLILLATSIAGCGGPALSRPGAQSPPAVPTRPDAQSPLAGAGASRAGAQSPLVREGRPGTERSGVMSAAAPSTVQRPSPRPAPTWSTLYEQYFAASAEGGCGRGGRCHAADMSTAPSAYGWLVQRGYIDGDRSPLVSTDRSCLRWFGGNMPPRGAPNAAAVRDLTAWVAAGAPND
jgi:hypothetical protein